MVVSSSLEIVVQEVGGRDSRGETSSFERKLGKVSGQLSQFAMCSAPARRHTLDHATLQDLEAQAQILKIVKNLRDQPFQVSVH